MSFNGASHFSFDHARLMKFLPPGSFALRMRLLVGNAIDCYFEPNDFDEGRSSLAYSRPVESLFFWIEREGGLNPDWLAEENGDFIDHAGATLADDCKPALTKTEQIAAYGLWFIEVEIGIHGGHSDEEYDENRVNPSGWREIEVVEHQASCLLNAYQALAYVERLAGEHYRMSEDEAQRATKIDFAALDARADERKRLSANALDAKHQTTRLAQDFIKREWKTKREAYGDNKSAFARDYVPILAHEFKDNRGDPFKITEKQMRDVWLSDYPSARNPDGIRVDG